MITKLECAIESILWKFASSAFVLWRFYFTDSANLLHLECASASGMLVVRGMLKLTFSGSSAFSSGAFASSFAVSATADIVHSHH